MPLEGGHWERQRTPLRRVSRRERRVLAVALAALAALTVAIAVAAARSGPASPAAGRGCVELVAASTTGGATYRACGPAAARWCREAGRDASQRTLRARCGEAGLAVSRRRGPS
jgi:hypothetical protein